MLAERISLERERKCEVIDFFLQYLSCASGARAIEVMQSSREIYLHACNGKFALYLLERIFTSSIKKCVFPRKLERHLKLVCYCFGTHTVWLFCLAKFKA